MTYVLQSDTAPLMDDHKFDPSSVAVQYQRYHSYRELSYKGAADYAKWLLASMLACHLGLAVVEIQILEKLDKAHIGSISHAAALNVGGIFFILLAGFFAWISFFLTEALYATLSDPEIILNDRLKIQAMGRTNLINAIELLAGFSGLLSLATWFFAGHELIRLLSTLPV